MYELRNNFKYFRSFVKVGYDFNYKIENVF